MVFGLTSAAHAAASHRTLTLTLEEYPPYMGGSLSRHGIMTAVVQAAFDHAGIDVKLVQAPNNRAITGVQLGLYDGSFGWAKSPERERFLYFSDPVMPLRMVFCQHRNKTYAWQTLSDLTPWVIGVTTGNYYSDEFQALADSGRLHIDPANGDVENLHKLAAGRIDLFPISVETGNYLIQTALRDEERRVLYCQDRAYWTVSMHMVLSRKLPDGPQLVKQFNEALAAMRASGEYDRLVDDTRRETFRASSPALRR